MQDKDKEKIVIVFEKDSKGAKAYDFKRVAILDVDKATIMDRKSLISKKSSLRVPSQWNKYTNSPSLTTTNIPYRDQMQCSNDFFITEQEVYIPNDDRYVFAIVPNSMLTKIEGKTFEAKMTNLILLYLANMKLVYNPNNGKYSVSTYPIAKLIRKMNGVNKEDIKDIDKFIREVATYIDIDYDTLISILKKNITPEIEDKTSSLEEQLLESLFLLYTSQNNNYKATASFYLKNPTYISQHPNNPYDIEGFIKLFREVETTKTMTQGLGAQTARPQVRQAGDMMGHQKTTTTTKPVTDKKTTSQYEVGDSEKWVRMISEIKHRIVGQDEAIEQIVSNVWANQKLLDANNQDLLETQKAAMLIDGSTGTGKTAILKEVSKRANLPIVITSAANYSSTGYHGPSITDILVSLLKEAHGDLELAQRGIIVLDEFDKLASGGEAKGGLEMKSAMQQLYLKFIEGEQYEIVFEGNNYTFDTSNVTFACAGAFTKIREQKTGKKAESHRITGFATKEPAIPEEEQEEIELTDEDFIKFGLERELVARLKTKISTRSYKKEDYRKILLESEISPLGQFSEFALLTGEAYLRWNEAFIEEVCTKAEEINQGARGLASIFQKIKSKYQLRLLTGEYREKEFELTPEMVNKTRRKVS